MVVFAYSLADNSIIVRSSYHNHRLYPDRPEIFKTVLSLDKYPYIWQRKVAFRQPLVFLDIIEKLDVSNDGVPIVTGRIPLKISVDAKDRISTENSRYGIKGFIDTIPLFEYKDGFSPFTYQLDTSYLSEGEHLITINLLTYSGNCGVVTKKILVKK